MESHDSVSTVKSPDPSHVAFSDEIKVTASIYVAMLLFLLMIYTCSALRILGFKQELQLRYERAKEEAIRDLEGRRILVHEVPTLKAYVRNHWIMLETGSPQFMTASFVTTSACGVICVLSTILFTLITFFKYLRIDEHDSDYKWSVPVILVTQFTGLIVGTIAPVARCFASIKYQRIWFLRARFMVFEVESYWTKMISDWKDISLPFLLRNQKCMVVVEKLKILMVIVCVGFQKTMVVACKIIALIPLLALLCWMYLLKVMSFRFMIPRSHLTAEDHGVERQYDLQLQDQEPRTMAHILNSLDVMIPKVEKPKNIIKLLSISPTGFEGFEILIKSIYNDRFMFPNVPYDWTWSLPLVTLTLIATSLPDIPNNKLDSLLASVSEGLTYVNHVEKSLNAHEDVTIQKLAHHLWKDVVVSRKLVGNNLKCMSTRQILQLFNDTYKIIFFGGRDEITLQVDIDKNTIHKQECVEIMCCITQSIISNQDNIDVVGQETLFDLLSLIISDIFAACFTNLPQIIIMKCRSRKIEKAEKCVQAATQLLGETIEIIENLQCREPPAGLDPDEMPFFAKWQAALQDSIS